MLFADAFYILWAGNIWYIYVVDLKCDFLSDSVHFFLKMRILTRACALTDFFRLNCRYRFKNILHCSFPVECHLVIC